MRDSDILEKETEIKCLEAEREILDDVYKHLSERKKYISKRTSRLKFEIKRDSEAKDKPKKYTLFFSGDGVYLTIEGRTLSEAISDYCDENRATTKDYDGIIQDIKSGKLKHSRFYKNKNVTYCKDCKYYNKDGKSCSYWSVNGFSDFSWCDHSDKETL